MPSTPAALMKEEPRIESKKTYSPTIQNYTWAQAWNGPENSPLPDYNSVPYRNAIKNPSFEVGLSDWIYGSVGAGSTTGVVSSPIWYGASAVDVYAGPVAGAWSAVMQYTPISIISTTTLIFAIRQTAAVTANENSAVHVYMVTDVGPVNMYYALDNGLAALGVYKITVGTVANQFYYCIRNITADMESFGVIVSGFQIALIRAITWGNGLANHGYFDSFFLFNDQVMYQGSNPWYNNEFEDPRNAGADLTTNFYPIGWSSGWGVSAGTCSFQSGMAGETSPYLHRWAVQLAATAVNNALKRIYYTIGANPATYIPFAFYGNTLPVAAVVIDVTIADTTSGKYLWYEFGTGAAAIRAEDANNQVIHEQIVAATWYFRIKNWQTDWAAAGQFGVAPTLADTWSLRLDVNNIAAGANAITATFDAVWMGSALPPKYNCFMFGDFRNAAYSDNFNGETTAFLDEYGFDFDGLFIADDIGAATSRYAQITTMVKSQPYSTRHLTFGLGSIQMLWWIDGGGTEQLIISPKSMSTATWVAATTPNSDDIWNTGQILYPLGSTMTFDVTPTTTSYLKIQFAEITGAGGAIEGRILIRWMAVEVENPDSDISLSYSSIDGWGVPYDFVQTYVNGTRQVNAQFTVAHAVTDAVNISVYDFYDNPLISRFYTINLTVQTINIRLNLVSTTLQSYGLTRADIYGNVTFSELFNAATLDPTIWDDVTIGALTLVNGRVSMETFVPGDQVFLYTLDTYAVASTLTVYSTTDDLTDNFGIAVGAHDDVFPAGTEWWNIQTDPGGSEWILETRQGGGIGAVDTGGVVAADTWYKIVVTMTYNHVWATIYNPDETINCQLDDWCDNQVAPWAFYLENAANTAPTTTLFDLFIVQGNTGYANTLPFYDSGNTLLMPDDYVFNGTANNGAIRFQVATAITLTQNRLIQLVAPVILMINYHGLDSWGIPFEKVITYINGTRLNTNTFVNTSAIWHYFHILVTDYYGNTVYEDLACEVTQIPLTVDPELQLVEVSLESIGLTWCVITQIGGGGLSKNATIYESGKIYLYATAGGITYRFHGMAAIATNALIPAGASFDVTNVITTAQSRTVILMTNDLLQQILAGIIDANDKLTREGGQQGGGEPAQKDQVQQIIYILLGVVAFCGVILAVGVKTASKKNLVYIDGKGGTT